MLVQLISLTIDGVAVDLAGGQSATVGRAAASAIAITAGTGHENRLLTASYKEHRQPAAPAQALLGERNAEPAGDYLWMDCMVHR